MKAELQIQNNNPIDHNTTGLKGVNEDTTTDELLELMYGSKEESVTPNNEVTVTPDDAWLEEYLDTTPEPKQANTSHITHGDDMVFDDTPKKLGLCNDAIQKHTPTPIAKAVKEAALIPVYHGFIFDGQDKSIKSNETIKDIFDNYIVLARNK